MIPTTILAATDFSEPSRYALDWAADLAKAVGAKLVVAHVFDMPIAGFPDAAIMVDARTAARLSDEAQSALDAEVARIRDKVPAEGVLRQGDARDTVPALAASLGAQLIVVGSHGRRGFARALLGSVAESIVRGSTLPVTVVRPHTPKAAAP